MSVWSDKRRKIHLNVFPVSNSRAVFSKDESLYQCVLDDFKNAKFIGILTYNISSKRDSIRPYYDYLDAWLCGSDVYLSDDGNLIWVIESDGCKLDTVELREKLKEYSGWIEAQQIHWAVTDAEGNPMEMPADRIDQVWEEYGVRKSCHLDLKPVCEEDI